MTDHTTTTSPPLQPPEEDPDPAAHRKPFDEAARRIVLTMLTNGSSRRTAARAAGCAPSTIARAADRDPRFAAELARAEANVEIQALQSIRNAAQSERYWRAAVWLLERKNPADFAQHSGKGFTAEQVLRILGEVLGWLRHDIPEDLSAEAFQKLTTLLLERAAGDSAIIDAQELPVTIEDYSAIIQDLSQTWTAAVELARSNRSMPELSREVIRGILLTARKALVRDHDEHRQRGASLREVDSQDAAPLRNVDSQPVAPLPEIDPESVTSVPEMKSQCGASLREVDSQDAAPLRNVDSQPATPSPEIDPESVTSPPEADPQCDTSLRDVESHSVTSATEVKSHGNASSRPPEKTGLASSGVSENTANSTVSEVPVPIHPQVSCEPNSHSVTSSTAVDSTSPTDAQHFSTSDPVLPSPSSTLHAPRPLPHASTPTPQPPARDTDRSTRFHQQTTDLWQQWETIYTDPDNPQAREAAVQFYNRHRAVLHSAAAALWPNVQNRYTLMCLRAESRRSPPEHQVQDSSAGPDLHDWPEGCFGKDLYFAEWPSNLALRVLVLDPGAGSGSQPGRHSTFVRLGLSPTGILYVQADLAHRSTREMIADAVQHYRKFQPHAFGMEANQFQGPLGRQLVAGMRLQCLLGANPRMVHNDANKPARIRRLGPLLAARRLRMKSDCPSTRFLVHRLQELPVRDHHGAPDALAMAVRLAEEFLAGSHDVLGNPRPVAALAK